MTGWEKQVALRKELIATTRPQTCRLAVLRNLDTSRLAKRRVAPVGAAVAAAPSARSSPRSAEVGWMLAFFRGLT